MIPRKSSNIPNEASTEVLLNIITRIASDKRWNIAGIECAPMGSNNQSIMSSQMPFPCISSTSGWSSGDGNITSYLVPRLHTYTWLRRIGEVMLLSLMGIVPGIRLRQSLRLLIMAYRICEHSDCESTAIFEAVQPSTFWG